MINNDLKDISYLENILQNINSKNILVFTGKKSYKNLSAKNKIERILNKYNLFFYNDFDQNPKYNDILKAQHKINFNHDTTIAIGGGSVIDFAKVFNFLSSQPFDIHQYLKQDSLKVKDTKPLIAMPTTAGTGSETTKFAVIYIDNKKYSLEHKNILPTKSIVNPELIIDAPKYVRQTTAMDAFCQAIEGYFSVNANEESDSYALEALKIFKYYLKEYIDQNSFESAKQMCIASNLAGKTINISKTTVSHALSYFITSKYNIPHGHAVSLSIYGLIKYNIDETKIEKLLQPSLKKDYYLEKIKIFRKIDLKVSKIIKDSSLETRMSKLGINNIDEIISQINEQRLKNNPLKISAEDMKKFFVK